MSFLFHPPPDPTPALKASIQPLIDQEKTQSAAGYTSGTADVTTARTGLTSAADIWSKIGSGSPDELLKYFDASGITKATDENTQQLGDLGVRGGARAATLGGAAFTRDADLNRMLEQLKAMAPDKLAQIAQTIGNLGLGEESAAQGAGAQASNSIFGVANVGLQQQQAYYGLIGSIFQAGGSALGALLA